MTMTVLCFISHITSDHNFQKGLPALLAQIMIEYIQTFPRFEHFEGYLETCMSPQTCFKCMKMASLHYSTAFFHPLAYPVAPAAILMGI